MLQFSINYILLVYNLVYILIEIYSRCIIKNKLVYLIDFYILYKSYYFMYIYIHTKRICCRWFYVLIADQLYRVRFLLILNNSNNNYNSNSNINLNKKRSISDALVAKQPINKQYNSNNNNNNYYYNYYYYYYNLI